MWSIVQPSYWHPMSALEQSLTDFDLLEDMFTPTDTDTIMFSNPAMYNFPESDDDFFKDIPVTGITSETSPMITETPERKEQRDKEILDQVKQEDEETKSLKAQKTKRFSTYSSTHSIVTDEITGQVIESIRRRYEDSIGYLKAECKKRYGNKSLLITWKRETKQDEGQIEHSYTNCSASEFDQLWDKTPFGKIEKEKMGTMESKKSIIHCSCNNNCTCRSSGACTCNNCGTGECSCASCSPENENFKVTKQEQSGKESINQNEMETPINTKTEDDNLKSKSKNTPCNEQCSCRSEESAECTCAPGNCKCGK